MIFKESLSRDLWDSLPTAEPILASQLCEKLAASRDKALGGRKNARALESHIGEPCLIWDKRERQAANHGLDGASRSYWIKDDRDKSRLVHVSWLVRAPEPEQPETVQGAQNLA